jgi:hypothetical protein
MDPRTVERIDQLERAPWFSRVGIKAGPTVASVSSWPEAIGYCAAPEWEDLELEMANQFREYLHEHANARFQAWNKAVVEVKKVTNPLVEHTIKAVTLNDKLSRELRIQVEHDIDLICMEAEYADVCPLGFFTNLGAWYLNGHFPCGWWGNFPEGKLIVY